jgi:hypothetical protein
MVEPMTGIEPAYSAWEVDSARPWVSRIVHGGNDLGESILDHLPLSMMSLGSYDNSGDT